MFSIVSVPINSGIQVFFMDTESVDLYECMTSDMHFIS